MKKARLSEASNIHENGCQINLFINFICIPNRPENIIFDPPNNNSKTHKTNPFLGKGLPATS